MKAISLWEPWASLVACGRKRIETRSWATSHRGPLAIHAAKRAPIDGECPGTVGHDGLGNLMFWLPEPWTEEEQLAVGLPADGDLLSVPLRPGCVVATCILVDCLPINERWYAAHQAARLGVRGRSVMPRSHKLFGGDRDGLWLVSSDGGRGQVDAYIEDQLPYGDYRDGRWAWILSDVTRLPEPIPARGRQQLWDWEPDRAPAR